MVTERNKVPEELRGSCGLLLLFPQTGAAAFMLSMLAFDACFMLDATLRSVCGTLGELGTTRFVAFVLVSVLSCLLLAKSVDRTGLAYTKKSTWAQMKELVARITTVLTSSQVSIPFATLEFLMF